MDESPFYNSEYFYRCELCDLVTGDIKTRKYYRDKVCTAVDCLTCKVPMCVLNHHGTATPQEERQMEAVIHYLFPDATIRKEQRKIPATGPEAHIHWHILGAKYLGG